MRATGLPDQTSSQTDTHRQCRNTSLQGTRSAQTPTRCNPATGCRFHIEASRGQILRDLQNASEADLSESLLQPVEQGSADPIQSSRRFAPRSSLLQILNTRRVADHLSMLLDDLQSLNQIAEYVCPGEGKTCRCGDGPCTGGRIILASLMQIRKEGCIVSFYNRAKQKIICDSSLPISDENFPELTDDLTKKEKQLFRYAQSQLRYHYVRKLEPYDWNFGELDNEAALPYSYVDERIEPIKGAFSVVRHIRIDSDHHELGDEDDFALKTFKKSQLSGVSFDEELRANQKVPRHDRIVPVLTAFKHRQRFHFIFPYASGGNLEELWATYSTNNEPETEPAAWYSTQWLLTECRGIAESLAVTHKPTSHLEQGTQRILVPQLHADVKPSNILCFDATIQGKKSFVLKLADFGYAREVNENSTLGIGYVTHTKTYRPPEYDTEEVIHLNYDVWSLGCVFLEFITWAVLGFSEKESFATNRSKECHDPYSSTGKGQVLEDTFFKKCIIVPRWYDLSGLRLSFESKIKKSPSRAAASQHLLRISRGGVRIECKIKDSVTKHINKLRDHPMCAPEIRTFIDFIETRMLVIDSSARANSSDVEEFLRGITNR
ncbi:kinase-like protein [Xylaria arbuscula]|nr:kinase-like protein [Xylaria arbuscula]